LEWGRHEGISLVPPQQCFPWIFPEWLRPDERLDSLATKLTSIPVWPRQEHPGFEQMPIIIKMVQPLESGCATVIGFEID
jgi:hypothetical protein